MKVVILQIKIGGDGILRVHQLPELLERISEVLKPEERGDCVIVISGRLPVWAFAAITHHLHPFAAVCTFEPRLLKGVVVASHSENVKVGDLIELDNAEVVEITFP